MYAADELQAALYGAMSAGLSAPVVDDASGATYPYVVIGEITEAPDDQYDGQGTEVTATFHTWSNAPGMAETNGILAEIDAVLHRVDLVVDGARCWDAHRTFTTTLRDVDENGAVLRHGVARYRFRLEPAA